MKQNILLTCAALAAVCIFTAFLLYIPDLFSPAAPSPQTQQSSEDVPDVQRDTPTAQYYLRDYEGKLAVFLPDSQTPEMVFDVYLSTLPPYDRGELQLGVPVASYEELVERIEDYIS